MPSVAADPSSAIASLDSWVIPTLIEAALVGIVSVESLESLIEAWDGEEVVTAFDNPTGSWIFICIHSTALGPAGGGTRMKVYGSPTEGLADAMRLAAGMTQKLAVAGLDFGGGKAVLAVPELPEGAVRRRLLHRYGDMVESLHGTFWTAPDMNTSAGDMDVISERCAYVFSRSEERGGSGNPGPFTARGVYHGIKASAAHAFGEAELEGRSVLVQGVGSVGAALAELVAADGAALLVTDVDQRRARELAGTLGATVVPPENALATECDVYAPCALGGTLNKDTIPLLRARVVAGSANNQLAETEDAERLRAAGVLYAPDYVINSGGALYAAAREVLDWNAERIEAALAAIGSTLTSIYERADAEGMTTLAAADELAAARLAAAS
jgi:leucine dehydrogenase